jgi:signal-transduction protein with cAMP-binding, CBS, and nucleotidyltransferase domain
VGGDPTTTTVQEAMTHSPRCVKASDAAVDALCLMVENHFRHLPVSARASLPHGGGCVSGSNMMKPAPLCL